MAFVLDFTEQRWPWEQGGYLEGLTHDDQGVTVAERRPPGFNTLDIFDLTVPNRTHRIPILTEHHERRVLSGWFDTR